MNSQTQNDKQDKQSQLILENDLKQQLGLIGGKNSSLMGPGGLSIIQDENDSNQDSDFSGDEEDKQQANGNQPDGQKPDQPQGATTDQSLNSVTGANLSNIDPIDSITEPHVTNGAQNHASQPT